MASMSFLILALRLPEMTISLKYYRQHFRTSRQSAPDSGLCADTTFAIPLHNRMVEGDFVRVATALRELRA